jgi:transposase
MADVVDVRTRQRAVIEFLTAEGSSPIEIHRRLRSVYGEDAIDVSSVRHWVRRFKSGEKDIGDRPRSGRPATAATKENKENVDALIRDDRRITTSELCSAIGTGKPAVMVSSSENLATVNLRKVGAENAHRRTQNSLEKNICVEYLRRNEKDGDAFLLRIITGDKNRVHHYNPLTK